MSAASPAPVAGGGDTTETDDELAALDRAVATVLQQRDLLGPDVVEVTLASLRLRRQQLLRNDNREQRKLVTVLFADLIDFTVLSQHLDPEDTRTVMARYFERWQEIIDDHGGTVEKFIGDAVMAVFGLYRSEEDDAQRAVRVALAMAAALPALNAELRERFDITLSMRVGVDTGDVVISTLDERAGHEFVVVGPTVNRASRLQSVAPTNRVLISADTARQVRGRFNLEQRPDLELKGHAEPVDGYLVTSERPLAFQADRAGGVAGVQTSTIGRDGELRLLTDQLRAAVEGHTLRMVTVVGDPGVGKSRLLFDFDAWIGDRPETYTWFRGRASPLGRNRPYALLHDVLRGRLQIADSDDPVQVRTKFESGLPSPGALVVATWLGFELNLPAGSVPTDPESLQAEAEAALAEVLAELAEAAPVAILLEDLHWADDASLSWLSNLPQRLAGVPLIVVGTARPTLLERRPHWFTGDHRRLELAPLSAPAVHALAAQLLQRLEQPPAELIELVVTGAEGNPFYLEELIAWLIDTHVIVVDEPRWRVSAAPAAGIAVPSTLRGLLQARLDTLSSAERAVAQRASVVGRVFWDEAVAALDDAGADAATDPPETAFDGLRRHQIAFERERSAFESAREYVFKHALLRDVAYDGVLRSRRERYHRFAADWLTEVCRRTGREQEYAALIAEHLDKGRDSRAGSWYLRAGRAAAAVYALDDAARLLDRALAVAATADAALRFDVVAAQEDVCERLGRRGEQQRLLDDLARIEQDSSLDPGRRLRLLLGRARRAFLVSDYAAAVRWAGEALVLAEREARSAQSAEALLWRGKARVWNDDLALAGPDLERALAVAEDAGQSYLVGESLRYLAMAANNAGRYVEALELSTRAQAAFSAGGHVEAATTAKAMHATTCYNMGRIAEARAGIEELLVVFARTQNRYRQAVSLGNLASIAATQGELPQAERWAREAAALTDAMSDREATAVNLTVVGEVELLLGRTEAAIATFARVRDLAGADKGSAGVAATALALTAVAHLQAGQPEQALAAAVEAVAVSPEASAPIDRGRALLALGYADNAAGRHRAAELAFGAAIEVFTAIDRVAFVCEARVGQATALNAQGETTRATELARSVTGVGVRTMTENCLQPTVMLRDLWRVLRSTADPAAELLRAEAGDYLRAQARLIGEQPAASQYLARPEIVELLDPTPDPT